MKLRYLFLLVIFSTVFTYSQVVMNEIWSRGTASDPDWIEIYNDGNLQVDITGYKIYDNGGQSGSKPKKEFPAGTVIPSKGFYVIIVDDADPSGFGLSSNGEKVWLENATGTVIDTCTFPAMNVDQSYGRYPDGASLWKLLNPITKGSSNVVSLSSFIVMNEIYSRGTAADPDWIEIYNKSNGSIDITGYKIYDNGGFNGTKPKMEFPSGTVIPANGFYVIVVDDGTASGFGLSSSGEQVWLEDAAGGLIDVISFPALDTNQVYGRVPDGESWGILNYITRGYSNVLPMESDIVMNEIYSRGTATDPDWIEIFNKSGVNIDISGYKIYDNGGQSGSKPKKEFPNGTVINSFEFFVIVVDDGSASGFGLSSNGEKVWLENNSGSIIDTCTFPAMNENESWSRLPDGGIWGYNIITRGFSNIWTSVDETDPIVTSFKLNQNYPNPFNPETNISFVLNAPTYIEINLYNVNGEFIKRLYSGYKQSGSYTVNYNAGNLSSGIYYYELKTGNGREVKKMTLMK